MATHDKSRDILVEEKQALGFYLESLLRDVPEADEPFVELEAPIETLAPPVLSAPVMEVAETITMPVVDEVFVAEALVETAPVLEPEPVVVAELEAAVIQPSTASHWEGRPEWAEEPFQALLFKLSGLSMAIPLIELDGILEWPDLLTPLPNRSSWYLGLLDNRGKTLPVIELAQLVLPQKLREKHEAESGAGLSRIILIGGGNWGIACDSVSEVITLQPDAVRWRSSRTKRKWLAGTVIDHMCALLDAEGLVHLLSSGREESAD